LHNKKFRRNTSNELLNVILCQSNLKHYRTVWCVDRISQSLAKLLLKLPALMVKAHPSEKRNGKVHNEIAY
jgi:hypothetical protein